MSSDFIRFRLRILFIVFGVTIIIGTFGFIIIEDLAPTDALYFTIVTIATVGYGDIHPGTPAGKLLAIVMIVMGVGTFLSVIAHATDIILNRREKQTKQNKINMVIGVFFSEVGMELLTYCSDFDPQLDEIKKDLIISDNWNDQDFSRVNRRLKCYNYEIETDQFDFKTLRDFLIEKREFLSGLMTNPILLEQESFTEALWAVFHLTEELDHRRQITHIPETDKEHLANDIKRAYKLLVDRWLDYMKHLKNHYPYLFSLAMRINPFDEKRSVIVK